MRHVSAFVFSLLLMAAIALLSRFPTQGAPPRAALRLSWKTVGHRVAVKAAEDPALPAHMRAPGGTFITHLVNYRLHVAIDGQTVADRSVKAGGLHHDRPLSVLEEVLVTPGTHPVDVSFTPDDSGEVTPNAPRYHLTQPIDFHAGRVCVVTLNEGRAALEVLP